MAAPNEVFLSHSSHDRRFVTRLAKVFQAHDIAFWYSRRHIRGSQQWHDEIGAALERCDWFLVVLSPSSIRSMWVKRELLFALRQERFENRIVPLLYRPCDCERLSWVLSSYQEIAFHRRFHEGCVDLLRLWGLEYQRETQGPLLPGSRRDAQHHLLPHSRREGVVMTRRNKPAPRKPQKLRGAAPDYTALPSG